MRRIATIVGLLLAVAPAGARAAGPPNIVLIIADDQAYTDFGFMGNPTVKTPNLDAMAKRSATYPDGYVPTSLCRASLATLLTGQFGHEHCICFNDPPEGVAREAAHPFLARSPALPRLLGSAGYRSLQTGKFWEGHYRNAGFTDGMTVKGRHGDEGLAIGRKTMAPIGAFLDADRTKSCFVWYAPMMPHEPHNPPENYRVMYEGRGLDAKTVAYYAMITWFDATVGELFRMLDERGLRESTLVLFVVDNGWVTPRAGDKGPYHPRSKNSPYEHGVRTPILIDWPGHAKAARHDGEVVSTIDVVPTLLDAAGVPRPEGLPGVSLLHSAEGMGKLDRDAVFGELYLHTAKEIERPAVNLTWRWMRRGPWKLIVPADKERPAQLFDLTADPGEANDMAGRPDQRERVAEMRAALDRWWNPESVRLDESKP